MAPWLVTKSELFQHFRSGFSVLLGVCLQGKVYVGAVHVNGSF